jgi:hypothetical protein
MAVTRPPPTEYSSPRESTKLFERRGAVRESPGGDSGLGGAQENVLVQRPPCAAGRSWTLFSVAL